MRRSRLGLAPVALAALALAAAGCGGSDDGAAGPETTPDDGAALETLSGEVGPGFDIAMAGTEGLTAGTYTIPVEDRSAIHNFHLTGPGVDVSTEVAATGATEFTVDLQPGEYTFVCDPHRSTMNGSFTVG